VSHVPSVRILMPLALLLGCAAPAVLAQRAGADAWLDRCRNDGSGDARAHYCEVRETGFKAGGAVTVEPGANGAIRISGWDRDSVAVTEKIRTQARTDAAARALAARLRIVAAGGTISAGGPSNEDRGDGEGWSVSFDVMVPRRFDLSARTTNGPIAVDGVAGRMDLDAVNGPLTLDGTGGDVHARTVNGPLTVTLAGAKWDGAGLDSRTTNGPVVLSIPSGYAAHLVTGTVNGPMRFDFPVTVTGHFDGRSIETDLGGGGPTIRAMTTNGPLTVRRR
jgi:hypothetical protein